MKLENGGATLAPNSTTYFPMAIYAAICRALMDSSLPAALRSTAAALAACADKRDPLKPIRAEQATLAAATGRDVRTIHRHLAKLVELGWITKAPQRRVGQVGRFKSGRFAGCLLTLTEDAIAQLGLAANVARDAARAAAKQARAAGGTNGTNGTKDTFHAIDAPAAGRASAGRAENDKMSDGHTLSGLTPTKENHRAARTAPTLPMELAPLHARGMWAKSICALMKKATAKGERLARVWDCVEHYVVKLNLTGARLKAYLDKVIAEGSGFANRAERLQARRAAERDRQRDACAVAAFVAEFGGQTWESADARELIAVPAAGGMALHRRDGVDGHAPLVTWRDVTYLRECIVHHQLQVRGAAAPKPAAAAIVPGRAASDEQGRAARQAALALLKRGRGVAHTGAPNQDTP